MTLAKRAAVMLMTLLLMITYIPAAVFAEEAPAAEEPADPAFAAETAAEDAPAEETIPAAAAEEDASAEEVSAESGAASGVIGEETPEPASGEDTDAAPAEEPDEAVREEDTEALPGSEEPAGPGEEDEASAEPEEEPAAEETSLGTDGDSFPSSLYMKQAQSGWCTLASATMMIRARFYLSGNDSWSSITQSGVYSYAWLPGSGLYFSWTYQNGGNTVTVSHSTVSGMSTSTLKSLLDRHPEGIVFYLYDYPHAIFVHDYQYDSSGNIIFYGSDTTGTVGYMPIGQTWLGKTYGGQASLLSRVDAYWYVSSYSIRGTTTYTVKFDPNGGSCSETSRTRTGGSKMGSLPEPTRKGYYFTGWYTSSGTQVTAATTVTGNLTLIAQWQKPSGTISFSDSPAVIRLYKGESTASVTVSGAGSINSVRFEVTMDEKANGKVTTAWASGGSGTSRTAVFTAAPSASGTYYAVFTMYDADTGEQIRLTGGQYEQRLTINVISDDVYLDIPATSVVFSDTSARETLEMFYGGTEGDLPEGYEVKVISGNGNVRAELGQFNGVFRPLYVSLNNMSDIYGAISASVTVQLLDPGGEICSEDSISVSIRPVSGSCAGYYDFDDKGFYFEVISATWEYSDGVLTIAPVTGHPDENGRYDMWTFDVGYTPWNCWADEIRKVVIKDGVTSIGSCAFYGCDLLMSIEIPDSVTQIGEKAFWGCSSLGSFAPVTIPGSVNEIKEDVFHGCSEMTGLKLSEGVQTITAGALTGCSALTDLYLPLSMRDIQLPSDNSIKDIWFAGSHIQWYDQDTASSVSSMLSSGAKIHFAVSARASESAKILNDMTGEDDDADSASLLSAQLLREIVGLD